MDTTQTARTTRHITIAGLVLDSWTNPFDATPEELVAAALEEAAVTNPNTQVNGFGVPDLLQSFYAKRRRFLDATRLGQLLIDASIVTYDQLQEGLMLQKTEALQYARPPRPLGEILVSMGYCTELQIAKALGQQDAIRVEADQLLNPPQKPNIAKLADMMNRWFKQSV
jgi:hypothetical protein